VPPAGLATEILFGKLTEADRAAVEAAIDQPHRWAWDLASPEERKRLTLALGLHYGVPAVTERTGLSSADPPDSVHSMVRGLVAETGGSYYYADMVLGSLEAVGAPLPEGSRGLDFSCSSARVVRALAAARPDSHWYGCDPNEGAIEWARTHLPQIDFFVSGIAPPLPFADGHFDVAFAISVWSHYNATAALRWLGEMHRLIRPGGHLLLTTHGFNSCRWFTTFRDHYIEDKLGERWLHQTWDRLAADGYCFWDVFGERGDWGVVDAEWGLAFFTPEWLLEHVTPAWSLVEYRIGRADGNQDLFVLERR
jgi:SAM-dependent methyltransferase